MSSNPYYKIGWTHYLKNYGEVPVPFEELLPKDPGRGAKTDGFTYMLHRSFYRPRDLISFFNKAIKYSNGGTKINRESINLAENDYSLERLNAIEDEWSENFDFMDPYFAILRGRNFKFTDKEITWKNLEKFCRTLYPKTRSKDLKSITNSGWRRNKENATRRHVLNVLYRIGCIGVKRSPELRLMYAFHYNNTLDSFQLNKEYVYYINPAFYKTLSIRTKIN